MAEKLPLVGGQYVRLSQSLKTFPIYDEKNRLLAFEIGSLRISRRGVCRVIKGISGAELVRRPKFLSWFREAAFCEFQVDGEKFMAEEPWGDNSRYWIGPNPARWLPQTKKVHEAFIRR